MPIGFFTPPKLVVQSKGVLEAFQRLDLTAAPLSLKVICTARPLTFNDPRADPLRMALRFPFSAAA
jgi:hypothetical protein